MVRDIGRNDRQLPPSRWRRLRPLTRQHRHPGVVAERFEPGGHQRIVFGHPPDLHHLQRPIEQVLLPETEGRGLCDQLPVARIGEQVVDRQQVGQCYPSGAESRQSAMAANGPRSARNHRVEPARTHGLSNGGQVRPLPVGRADEDPYLAVAARLRALHSFDEGPSHRVHRPEEPRHFRRMRKARRGRPHSERRTPAAAAGLHGDRAGQDEQ